VWRTNTIAEIQVKTLWVLNILTKKHFRDEFQKCQKRWNRCVRSKGIKVRCNRFYYYISRTFGSHHVLVAYVILARMQVSIICFMIFWESARDLNRKCVTSVTFDVWTIAEHGSVSSHLRTELMASRLRAHTPRKARMVQKSVLSSFS
jgi:hypothetical protein